MNFIEFESAQKLRGGYYTEPDIADFLTAWVLETRPARILEPSCGDGAFFQAIGRANAKCIKSLLGCELNSEEASKARDRARQLAGIKSEIHAGDFLEWFLNPPDRLAPFDAVLGNPPFVRYQYLKSRQQALAEAVFRQFNLHFTKHTNAWVPFIVASLALLRPGGRLAMVVPAELLHVLHAKSLRDFILAQCATVLVIDPEHIWFNDTLQGVVLLLVEKRGATDPTVARLAIRPVASRDQLQWPPSKHFARADFFASSILNGKWMVGLLNSHERTMLSQLERLPHIRPFGQVASVDVGIVTGANKFFLVTDAVVKEHGLERWAHPMFGRSDHVQGVIYDKKNHQDNRRLGLATNFLWFGDTPLEKLPTSVQRYIRDGESQGLAKRYKCRIRTPWYSVPSVYASPVGMLKRSHHFPRLVLNVAKTYTTDTAYRIVPQKVSSTDLVLSFVNSLTALSSELEGRHYGGGVLELVPSEIEKVLIPVAHHPLSVLKRLDEDVKLCTPPETLLSRQDGILLKPLGLTANDCETLRDAWTRLRDRRHRTTSDPKDGEKTGNSDD
jgi:adenine-specific DNA-methyltransferase